MLEINQEASNHCFKSAAPIVRRPGGPGGDTTARHHVEVPGATLDGYWLHAASVLFCKCAPPPYAHVLPLDASSHALAM